MQFPVVANTYNVLDWGAVAAARSVHAPTCDDALDAILATIVAANQGSTYATGAVIRFPKFNDPLFGYHFARPIVLPLACRIEGDLGSAVRLYFHEGIHRIVICAGLDTWNTSGIVGNGANGAEVSNLKLLNVKGMFTRWTPNTVGNFNPVLSDFYFRYVLPRRNNGFQYRCVGFLHSKNETNASTGPGPLEPAWPTTVGAIVDDGDYQWQCEAVTHGIWTHATMSAKECDVEACFGDAYRADSQYTDTNLWVPDLCLYYHCVAAGNGGSGIHLTGMPPQGGADSNVCAAYHCSFRTNGGYGVDDQGYSSNSFHSCHFDGPGTIRWVASQSNPNINSAFIPSAGNDGRVYLLIGPGVAGAVEPDWLSHAIGTVFDENGGSGAGGRTYLVTSLDETGPGAAGTIRTYSGTFLGCYTEGGYGPIDLGQSGTWFGGAPATGYDNRSAHTGFHLDSGGHSTSPFVVTNPPTSNPYQYSTYIGDNDGQQALRFSAILAGVEVPGYTIVNVGGFWALWGGSGQSPLFFSDGTGTGYAAMPKGHVTTPNGLWVGNGAYKNRLYSTGPNPMTDAQAHFAAEVAFNPGYAASHPALWVSSVAQTWDAPVPGNFAPVFPNGRMGAPLPVCCDSGDQTLTADQTEQTGMIIATETTPLASAVHVNLTTNTALGLSPHAAQAGRPFVFVNRTSAPVTFRFGSTYAGICVPPGMTCSAMGDGTDLIRTGPDV